MALKPPSADFTMTTSCPFCAQQYEIEANDLHKHIECEHCKRRFACSVVAIPIIGGMYVDIETTKGFEVVDSEISTVVWWCDGEWHSFVNGTDAPAQFVIWWRNARQVFTFNGKAFDEPRICRFFDVDRHRAHVDLMHEARSKGLTGGLKELAASLDINRPEEIRLVRGNMAVRLWHRYCHGGDCDALMNLLYYNAWDVVLTYSLHMRLLDRQPLPIHESIPWRCSHESLTTMFQEPRPKRIGPTGKPKPDIVSLWAARRANPLATLRGADVCFTGDLTKIDRDSAEDLVSRLGATARSTAVRTLDFLVVGADPGAKLDKAEENIKKGAHTRIVMEDEFWELVRRAKESSPT